MKMNCSQVNKLKEAYVDGRLGAAPAEALEEHVARADLVSLRARNEPGALAFRGAGAAPPGLRLADPPLPPGNICPCRLRTVGVARSALAAVERHLTPAYPGTEQPTNSQ